jgi:RNA polymerase-interacting CarD/CdnL/TRCF family regulator
MDLHTGDRVVHPQYGAGVVRGQCALTTNGATHDYYLIETPATHSTIYVDRLAADAGQLGAVMTAAHLPALIALLASQPQPLPISSLER